MALTYSYLVPSKKEKLPLSVTHPDLAKEADGWDPALHTEGMNKTVAWKCNKNHQWMASIFRRTHGSGCPVCSNRKIVKGINDFATTHPILADEVVVGDPSSVSGGSDKKFTWRCALGHIWVTSVGSRVLKKTGCPICAGSKVLPGFNDLESMYPDLALQADGWDPKVVSPGSHESRNWKCRSGHTWIAKVQSRVLNSSRRSEESDASGCPYCYGRKAWVGFNDLNTTHPEVVQRLVDKKQGEAVTFGSESKLEWFCPRKHIFLAPVVEMVKPGNHCPYCSGSKVLEGFNDLETTHPFYAAQLLDLDPSKISSGSKKIGKWKCSLGHLWKSSINTRISNSVVCPYCSGSKVLKGFNDLATTHPELALEADGWDPSTFTRGSGKTLNWKCLNGHPWRAKLTDRTTRKSGCPSCAKSGFNPNLDGYIYFINHPIWLMYQIGITNSPDIRLKNHKNSGWELLELRGPMDGHLTQQWETAILRMLKTKGVDLSNAEIAGKFDGYSEAWSRSTFEVNSIKELMRLTEEFEDKG
jgi:hypothetical protein